MVADIWRYVGRTWTPHWNHVSIFTISWVEFKSALSCCWLDKFLNKTYINYYLQISKWLMLVIRPWHMITQYHMQEELIPFLNACMKCFSRISPTCSALFSDTLAAQWQTGLSVQGLWASCRGWSVLFDYTRSLSGRQWRVQMYGKESSRTFNYQLSSNGRTYVFIVT